MHEVCSVSPVELEDRDTRFSPGLLSGQRRDGSHCSHFATLRAGSHECRQSWGEAASALNIQLQLLDAAVPEAIGLLSYVNPLVSFLFWGVGSTEPGLNAALHLLGNCYTA